ncbi:hypothetical protein VHEMI10749 [[Torrubiella] hemipterigena]|uniref:Uncharacterized protein n=1 Tax=[Torrubiella] hemipterigena TaxID=1531966 RepID=A0A0A1TJI5_9HYPO|nr:hypothetical protein VHEMI10749 [[Torrubiella] hemipterigena]
MKLNVTIPLLTAALVRAIPMEDGPTLGEASAAGHLVARNTGMGECKLYKGKAWGCIGKWLDGGSFRRGCTSGSCDNKKGDVCCKFNS